MQMDDQRNLITGDHAAETIAALGRAIGAPFKHPDAHGLPFVVLPNGYEAKQLLPEAHPQHPKCVVKMRDAVSFIRYINDHKVAASRVYASMQPASFLGVIDDHHPVTAGDSSVSVQADWREFRVEFAVPASREWTLWNGANRKQMTQLAFAEFLQDNLPDVVVPDSTRLLELALNFEVTNGGAFRSAQRLQNGDHNITIASETAGASTVALPEFITLNIPVFENEPPRELLARLRYRAKDQLVFWYELVRPHKVLEAAFRETWARIAEGTSVPVLLGSPE